MLSPGEAAEDRAGSKGFHSFSCPAARRLARLVEIRLLRALASVNVFEELADGRFALTPLAECLQSDVADSVDAYALAYGEDSYGAWGELPYSIQSVRKANHLVAAEEADEKFPSRIT